MHRRPFHLTSGPSYNAHLMPPAPTAPAPDLCPPPPTCGQCSVNTLGPLIHNLARAQRIVPHLHRWQPGQECALLRGGQGKG